MYVNSVDNKLLYRDFRMVFNTIHFISSFGIIIIFFVYINCKHMGSSSNSEA